LALSDLSDKSAERLDLTSFSQLVQELINGAVRRHTFSPWELELLLDLQTCRARKSARAELLRRYLKAVQQQFALDGSSFLRLADFIEREQQRSASHRSAQVATAVAAPCAT
jgi:hypothetical protein